VSSRFPELPFAVIPLKQYDIGGFPVMLFSSGPRATIMSLLHRLPLCCGIVGTLFLVFGPLPATAADAGSERALSPAPIGTLTPSSSSTPSTAPTATATQATGRPEVASPVNLSTRMEVGTDDRVSIAGLVIAATTTDRPSFLSSSAGKRILLRGIGPSLVSAGIPNALPNPVLELFAADGSLITKNDNWTESLNRQEIEATGAAPANSLESAIITTLDPGTYTVVLKGKDEVTGVGLIEIYDLNQGSGVKLVNISTRGLVQAGDNVMIGGLVLGPEGSFNATVLIRAIGPALANQEVADPLSDPVLELRDANGAVIRRNDNWKDDQQNAIAATDAAPSDDRESAMIATLAPGNYTVIVTGKDGQSGVALLEIDRMPPAEISQNGGR
jgi:hypothetical protein